MVARQVTGFKVNFKKLTVLTDWPYFGSVLCLKACEVIMDHVTSSSYRNKVVVYL